MQELEEEIEMLKPANENVFAGSIYMPIRKRALCGWWG
jgi:hypothetical protein